MADMRRFLAADFLFCCSCSPSRAGPGGLPDDLCRRRRESRAAPRAGAVTDHARVRAPDDMRAGKNGTEHALIDNVGTRTGSAPGPVRPARRRPPSRAGLPLPRRPAGKAGAGRPGGVDRSLDAGRPGGVRGRVLLPVRPAGVPQPSGRDARWPVRRAFTRSGSSRSPTMSDGKPGQHRPGRGCSWAARRARRAVRSRACCWGRPWRGLPWCGAAYLPFSFVMLVWFLLRSRTLRLGWLCACAPSSASGRPCRRGRSATTRSSTSRCRWSARPTCTCGWATTHRRPAARPPRDVRRPAVPRARAEPSQPARYAQPGAGVAEEMRRRNPGEDDPAPALGGDPVRLRPALVQRGHSRGAGHRGDTRQWLKDNYVRSRSTRCCWRCWC